MEVPIGSNDRFSYWIKSLCWTNCARGTIIHMIKIRMFTCATHQPRFKQAGVPLRPEVISCILSFSMVSMGEFNPNQLSREWGDQGRGKFVNMWSKEPAKNWKEWFVPLQIFLTETWHRCGYQSVCLQRKNKPFQDRDSIIGTDRTEEWANPGYTTWCCRGTHHSFICIT